MVSKKAREHIAMLSSMPEDLLQIQSVSEVIAIYERNKTYRQLSEQSFGFLSRGLGEDRPDQRCFVCGEIADNADNIAAYVWGGELVAKKVDALFTLCGSYGLMDLRSEETKGPQYKVFACVGHVPNLIWLHNKTHENGKIINEFILRWAMRTNRFDYLSLKEEY